MRKRIVYSAVASALFIATSAAAESFNQDLALGSQGSEVSLLQELLRQQSEIYPRGTITGTLDGETQLAVQRFQRAMGIDSPSLLGYVEKTTRSYLNALLEERSAQDFNAAALAQQAYYVQSRSAGDFRSLELTLESRAEALRRLFSTSPAKAYALRLTKKQRNLFPKDLRALIEEEVHVKGPLLHAIYDYPGDPTGFTADRFILQPRKGPPLQVFTPGTPLHSSPLATFRGIRLGTALIPEPTAKGTKLRPQPAVFPSQPRLIVLALQFPDRSIPSTTRTEIEQHMLTLRNYFREATYNRISPQSQVVAWLTSRKPYAAYPCDIKDPDRDPFREMQEEAIALADSQVTFSAFDAFMLILPSGSECGAGGFASGGTGDFLTRDGHVSLYASVIGSDLYLPSLALHEFGHNLGLGHANSINCGLPPLPQSPLSDPACDFAAYGDFFDIMGTNHGHLNAVHKFKLGALTSGGSGPSVITAPSPGIYTLTTLETPDATAKALRLPRGNGSSTWIEYRQPIGFDQNPWYGLHGAMAHLDISPSENSFSESQIITAIPDTDPDQTSRYVFQIGKTLYDPLSDYAITTLARSSTELALQVERFPPLSCSPAKQILAVGRQVTFTATGGRAPLVWSAPAASPSSGNGTTFPTAFTQPGHAIVTVGVQGTSITAQCDVEVTPPPTSDFTINGQKHAIMVPYGSDVNVAWTSVGADGCWLTSQHYDLTCPYPCLSGSSAYHVTRQSYFSLSCAKGFGRNSIPSVPEWIEVRTSSAATPTTAQGNNAHCIDISTRRLTDTLPWYGWTALTDVQVGEAFEVTVTMQNTGTKAWETNATPHRLIAHTDYSRWSSPYAGLPRTIAPGDTAVFTFTTSWIGHPAYSDWQEFEWQMAEEGVESFGETCRALLKVWE